MPERSHYLELVLRAPVKMDVKLLEQIQEYSDWIELQEKMQGSPVIRGEMLT
ncbi:MAG TPA: hypothetical protein VM681_10140 [Candidatus Thermoplasmatota archaeon]|nr:hypothetical protein [Candidatus Thermoplasmatota archaeon]